MRVLKKLIKKFLKKIFIYTSHRLGVKYETYTSGFSSYFINAKLPNTDYHKPVLTMDQGNQLIYDLLNSNKPFLICRFGDGELSAICNYVFNIIVGEKIWDEYIKSIMTSTVDGNDTPNNMNLERFSTIYLENSTDIDVLGVWNNRGEDFVTRYLCPKANLVPLQTLEPFFFKDLPWSLALKGKKVLIVHPFVNSIKKQHKNLHLIFNGTFPDFNLVTYKPFNISEHGRNEKFNWFEKLEEMKKDISDLDFDVALVAAGAFGFPLAAHIKKIGKQSIHVGGALQLFFGIKGKRWENREHKNFFNHYWVYPSDAETPPLKIRLDYDKGDYWK
jgi:hypothetical protein